MSSRRPHDGQSRIIRQHGGLLSAAHKDIEEQELPAPDLGESAPKPPGRAEDEPDPDFVKPDPDKDKMPNLYKERVPGDGDPSMQKGIPGPGITPPNEEDI